MIRCFLMLGLLALTGCDWWQSMKNEGANKHEYSIVESLEYKYRETKNERPYLVIKNTLGTGSTIVGFPIRGQSAGYVVMLAEAEGTPKVKALPTVDFVVTREALEAVKSETPLSKEVETFITAHIQPGDQ